MRSLQMRNEVSSDTRHAHPRVHKHSTFLEVEYPAQITAQHLKRDAEILKVHFDPPTLEEVVCSACFACKRSRAHLSGRFLSLRPLATTRHLLHTSPPPHVTSSTRHLLHTSPPPSCTMHGPDRTLEGDAMHFVVTLKSPCTEMTRRRTS